MKDFAFVAIPSAGSSSHSIGITTSGDAYSWGKNNFGQLGRSTQSQRDKEPRLVQLDPSNQDDLPHPLFVKAFVGGSSEAGHSALLDSHGHLWLAGCDRWQQLSLGASAGGSSGYTWNQGRIWRTQLVRNDFISSLLAPNKIRDVALGGDHTVVLSSNQQDVFVFGKGGDGQLGLDGRPFVSAPTRSKLLSSSNEEPNVAAVCAFQQCSLTLDNDKKVLKKAGRCRNISKALRECIQHKETDGLLSMKS